MKVLSLWQPWATLMAIGAKKIETRHWYTRYRGPLVIHAAKTLQGIKECDLNREWGDPTADPFDDKADYDATAEKLVGLFVANFAKFADHVDQGVRDSAPGSAREAREPVTAA